MTSLKITGRIHFIYDEQTISDKFKKREFIIEQNENPQYPQFNILEFTQDKCALLDGFAVDQVVDVEFNLNGRLHTGKDEITRCYNTCQAWKINLNQG